MWKKNKRCGCIILIKRRSKKTGKKIILSKKYRYKKTLTKSLLFQMTMKSLIFLPGVTYSATYSLFPGPEIFALIFF